MKNRILSLLLALCLIVTMAPALSFRAIAADGDAPENSELSVIGSGEAGDNIVWNMYSDGTLYFSGSGAMYDCEEEVVGDWYVHGDEITALEFGEGITYVGAYTFNDSNTNFYENLKTITIPSSVTAIGGYAFCELSGLERVHISDLDAWCAIAFGYGYDDFGTSAGATANPLENGVDLYLGAELVTDLVIPETVSEITDFAFKSCTSIQTATIGPNVTHVGSFAFNSCTNLTDVYFQGSAPTFGEHVFTLDTLTVWYPAGDSSWDAVVGGDYGGDVTWCAYVSDVKAPEILSCYSTQQTSVKVTWSLVENADGYQLYRTTTPEDDASWTCVKTVTNGEADRYTNQGLEVGVTYYYKVRAYVMDENGEKVYSDFSEISYMPASVVWDEPYSNATFRIRLRWNEINGAHGYQIWRQNEDGTWAIVKTLGDKGNELTDNQGATTAYSNTGLTAGENYTYKMRAFMITEDGRKVFGAYSDEFTVAVMPEAPVVTGTSPKATRAQLTWDAVNGAAGYQIWMLNPTTGEWAIAKSITDGSTSYTKYDLTSGTEYQFKVRAYTEVDGKKTFSAYSEIVSVTVK